MSNTETEQKAMRNKQADSARADCIHATLARHKKCLREMIETDFGLLDELRRTKCLTGEQYRDITGRTSDLRRTDRLLQFVVNMSVKNYDLFVATLKKTNQQHIVNYLQYDGDCQGKCANCEPLGRLILTSWKHNFEALMDLIDPKFGLVEELQKAGIITTRYRQYIDAGSKDSEKNMRLLEIMRRRSVAEFSSFLTSLGKNQPELVKILQRGVVAEIQARVTIPENPDAAADSVDKSKAETTAVESTTTASTDVVTPRHSDNKSKSLPLQSQAVSPGGTTDTDPGSIGPPLVAIKKENKYSLYILCLTPASIRHVDKLMMSGTMKSSLDGVFALLANSTERNVLTTLEWKTSDYNRCVHFYQTSLGFYNKINKVSNVDESDIPASTEFYFNRISVELREMVLLKAVVVLYKTISQLTSRDARTITMTSLNFVCRDWWSIITGRTCNRLQLRRTLAYMFRPYSYHIGHVTCLEMGAVSSSKAGRPRFVSMAPLDGCLFVADSRANAVLVYSDSPPYRQLDDVRLKKATRWKPVDIVACADTHRLYVGDSHNKCVWRLDRRQSGDLPSKFIRTKYKPGTLSVTSRRLLVTPCGGDRSTRLHQYSADGRLLTVVKLASDLTPSHAVETTRGTFVVCHHGETRDRRILQDQIVEVDREGHVLRVFGGERGDGPRQLNGPSYLLLDVRNGRVLVADSENSRVLVLSPRLRLERVLLALTEDINKDKLLNPNVVIRPQRMCFIVQTGQLAVGMTDRVDVFDVSNSFVDSSNRTTGLKFTV